MDLTIWQIAGLVAQGLAVCVFLFAVWVLLSDMPEMPSCDNDYSEDDEMEKKE